MELLAVFFVVGRLTGLYGSAADSRENRLSKQKCRSVRVMPTQNEDSCLRFCFPIIHRPPSAKGWSDFRLHNRGIFGLILGLLEATVSVHESICFIGHPPQAPARTPSGLRADSPVHRKSSPTHPRASASQNPHRLRTP